MIEQNLANNAAALFAHSESESNDISVIDLFGSLVVNNGDGGAGSNVMTLTRGQAFIRYTTFADNDVVQGSVIGSGGGLLDIDSSIIHQVNGLPTYLAFSPNVLSTSRCLMLSSFDDFNGVFGSKLLMIQNVSIGALGTFT